MYHEMAAAYSPTLGHFMPLNFIPDKVHLFMQVCLMDRTAYYPSTQTRHGARKPRHFECSRLSGGFPELQSVLHFWHQLSLVRGQKAKPKSQSC